MAINPIQLLKLKEHFSEFKKAHPKFIPFWRASRELLQEGTVLEFTVKAPDGQTKQSRIRLTAKDLETLEAIRAALGKK